MKTFTLLSILTLLCLSSACMTATAKAVNANAQQVMHPAHDATSPDDGTSFQMGGTISMGGYSIHGKGANPKN